MKKALIILVSLALTLMALPVLSASAGEKPFPNIVPALDDSLPEGFAIGKGHTAYNGSVDGSIYKVDLRSGEGEVLVDVQDPLDCTKLGMRVDSRTNYLFVAGCFGGNAFVFDADSGQELMSYQLVPPGSTIINDLTITKDAVFFTDFFDAFIYRLPLSKNGGIPADENAATAMPLTGDFEVGDGCCTANGIVATPNGKTLIVGHSGLAKIYRVDPMTGYADEIEVSPPLSGFLDGLVMHGRTLYIMNPDMDAVQVVELDKEMLTGEFVGVINDPSMSGVASGALFGKSLYVNNAHYDAFDEEGNVLYTERWITKLNRHAVEPVE